MNDIFTDGMTPEQRILQEVFEAQLLHLAKMIKESIPNHRHYTDDCGDYLTAALDLSSKMAEMRIEGIEVFEDEMEEWRKEARAYEDPSGEPDDYHGAEAYLLNNYASDGIAPEVYTWMIDET